MKSKAFKFTLLLILISGGCLSAQKSSLPFMDTIIIKTDYQLELTLNAHDFTGIIEPFRKDVLMLRDIIQKDSSAFLAYEHFIINYHPGEEISIKPEGEEERLVFEGGRLNKYHTLNRCIINAASYNADIRFNDLNILPGDSIMKIVGDVFDILPEKAHFAVTYHFKVENGQVKALPELEHVNGPYDALNLKIGAGAGIIKNQIVTDLSAELGLQFSRHGLWWNQYYVSDNLFYLFDNQGKIRYNNCINLGFRHNLSTNPDKTNWLGVELGYLVNRQGDFFDRNTFKIGFNWDLGRYISVSPALYISDGFRKNYPGIRIGIGF
jgi:hypothetical protein